MENKGCRCDIHHIRHKDALTSLLKYGADITHPLYLNSWERIVDFIDLFVGSISGVYQDFFLRNKCCLPKQSPYGTQLRILFIPWTSQRIEHTMHNV